MTYEIRWTESAYRKLEKLDAEVRKRIVCKLGEIVEDPFNAAKRLSGASLYSLRVGEYRVIMSIERLRMMILVINVGHGSKIYRTL